MKTILILGSSIKTDDDEKKYSLLNTAAKQFADVVYSPLDTAAFEGTSDERYSRAFDLVQKADIVLCEVSGPSTGLGMELREAATYNKPIFLVAKEGSIISDLVRSCPVVKGSVFYHSLDDIKERVYSLLTEHKNLFYM